MNSKTIFRWILLCHCFLGFSQNTVIHKDVSGVVVKSEGKATYHHYKKWTVNNEAQKEHGYLLLPYGNFREIKNLSLNIYDAHGNRIKKVKKSDFFDRSLSQGFEVDDSRGLFYMYSSPNYPVTFELEFEMKLNGLLFVEGWEPVFDYGVTIESGTFTVESPNDNPVKFKSYNLSPPLKTEESGSTIYTWTISKPFAAIETEAYSPALRNYTPAIQLAATEFKMESYRGHFKSWHGLAQWCESLLEGRSELSEETQAYIHQNFSGIEDPRERTKQVYKWVQSKTRYVSIQLGIGGWQPMPASEVDKNGYGDCKALTNYTRAALKAAGINSYYSLVYAGVSDKVDIAFPASSFNHVVLSVPLNGDTVWLECTDQKSPFGQMSPMTIGKYSLIVNGANSRLARVKSIDNENVYKTSFNSHLDLGNIAKPSMQSEISYSGLTYRQSLDLVELPEKKLREHFIENVAKPSTKINSIKAIRSDQVISLKCEFSNSGLIKTIGNQILISPAIFQPQFAVLPFDQHRKNAIAFPFGYQYTDTFCIALPADYKVTYLPEGQSVTNQFGTYNIQYKLDNETLTVIAFRELNSGTFTSEDYESIREFISTSNNLMTAGVVLTKISTNIPLDNNPQLDSQ